MISLRNFSSTDAEELQRLLNDQDVSRYLSSRVNFPYTLEDANWWVTQGSHHHPTWAIIAKQKLVGCIGIVPGQFDESHTAEIGYWLGKCYWGKGYTAAALEKVTTDTFRAGSITRLTAAVYHPNTASMQVLKKCGFSLEGVLQNGFYKHGRYFDKHLFAKIRTL